MTTALKKGIRRLGLTKVAKRVWKSFNYQYSFTLNGTRLRALKLYGADTLESEIWMGQVLRKLLQLQPEGTFVDVGVNVGQTLMQLRSLDAERPYVGFEPNPSCNMFTEELIRINQFKNVKLIPVGLYNEDSLMEMNLYYEEITNPGGSVVQDYWAYQNIKPYRTLVVPLMSVETVNKFIQLENMSIVKIDVEGAEMEVLDAMRTLIERDRPCILIEILSAHSTDNTIRYERQQRVLDMLASMNYTLHRIIEAEDTSLRGLMTIDTLDPSFDSTQTNYLLVHADDATRVAGAFEQVQV